MDFEKELERLTEEYAQEGYSVILHPQGDQLPVFARDFGVALLATRGEEHVLVQVVKNRSDLEADPTVPAQAAVTNKQPGWSYDLVILSGEGPFQRLTRGAREPSHEEINDVLTYVEKMMQAGDVRAAYVFGWSAAEAAMRQVASDAELYMPRTTPGELLRTLYGNGFLTREEFDRLNRSFRVRTEIVHGLVPPAIDPTLVHAIVAATRRLLTERAGTQGVAS